MDLLTRDLRIGRELVSSRTCGSVLLLQVVIEGLVERKSWGDIAVDDIKILDGISMAECHGTSGVSESASEWVIGVLK